MWTRRTLFLAVLAGALPLMADAPMTRLQIEVKNQRGKPIERASVVVKFIAGRSAAKFGKKIKTSWELRTNQDGLVKIPPIPQGDILIQVIAKGYQTHGKTYTVEEEEKTVSVELNPPQPQYSVHTDSKPETKN
ncbi:MAG: carboxypeptidase-like regulatory domain-containing protein [Bryobacteraceae bacterium]